MKFAHLEEVLGLKFKLLSFWVLGLLLNQMVYGVLFFWLSFIHHRT